MNPKTLSMLAVGDIILGADAEPYFAFVAPVLKAADVVLGQLEVPHTIRDQHAVELGRFSEVAHVSLGPTQL